VVEVVEAGGNGWWYVRRQRDGQKGFVPASFFTEGLSNASAASTPLGCITALFFLFVCLFVCLLLTFGPLQCASNLCRTGRRRQLR
jgi:hypothetical protein